MACTIQFESHRGELAFIYQLEHDPAVLEFYDQPGAIKLSYPGKDGKRRVTTWHTPDFFVIREDRAGWTECKMEERQVKTVPNAVCDTLIAQGQWTGLASQVALYQYSVYTLKQQPKKEVYLLLERAAEKQQSPFPRTKPL